MRIIYRIYEDLCIIKFKLLQLFFQKSFNVATVDETINKIISDKLSLARLGDGEMEIIMGRKIGYQKRNDQLAAQLKKVLVNNHDFCLVGVVEGFNSLANLTKTSKRFWMMNLGQRYFDWYKFLKGKKFYNAHLTRPYLRYQDKENTQLRYDKLKQIWQDKDVIFVEGELTRLGVGNDLFNNTKSIKRILCPAENAFNYYENIKQAILSQGKHKLFLLALGPTATVLAYELSQNGYQLIDLGHIDVEYEYFKKNMPNGGILENKYVNECQGGQEVSIIKNAEYEKQIILKVGD